MNLLVEPGAYVARYPPVGVESIRLPGSSVIQEKVVSRAPGAIKEIE